MHKPTGLGIYAMGQWESMDKTNEDSKVCGNPGCLIGRNVDTGELFNAPDTDMWGVKPFWRKTWGATNRVGFGSLGATTFYGEYAQYNDFFGASLANGINANLFNENCTGTGFGDGCIVVGSEMERWGLGVVQEIDAAAMHLWARWQIKSSTLTCSISTIMTPTSVHHSKISICTRSVGSSSSKPNTERQIEAAPSRGGFFLP